MNFMAPRNRNRNRRRPSARAIPKSLHQKPAPACLSTHVLLLDEDLADEASEHDFGKNIIPRVVRAGIVSGSDLRESDGARRGAGHQGVLARRLDTHREKIPA